MWELGYGTSITNLNHLAANSVDKILKGIKQADLRVEQPTAFDLGINVKTAKSLGLTMRQPRLQCADGVIQ